jgi:hypothetical protein
VSVSPCPNEPYNPKPHEYSSPLSNNKIDNNK